MHCISKQPQQWTKEQSFIIIPFPLDTLRSHALCYRPSFFGLRLTTTFFSAIVKAQVNIMTRVRSLRTGVSGACAGMRATARCAVTIFSEYRPLECYGWLFLSLPVYLCLNVLLITVWQISMMPYNCALFLLFSGLFGIYYNTDAGMSGYRAYRDCKKQWVCAEFSSI